MSAGDALLVELLAGHRADHLRAKEGIRTVGRKLLARRVLALEPTAVLLEVIMEESEAGARADSAIALDKDGAVLRSFEGDSEDEVDEEITGLLETAVPDRGSDEWFGLVYHLDSFHLDLVAAADNGSVELAAA